MNKYIVEFIGTFFLVFTVGNVVLNPDVGALGALAIGSALLVMVYAGGHVSGGHYNPAVTLAVTMCGKCAVADVVPYFVAQVLGAVAAAVTAMFLWGGPATAAIDFAAEGVLAKALVAEGILTFALCFVVLNVATASATEGNSYFGLAIGFVVLIGAITVGSISGGAFNPAVAVGLCVIKKAAWANIWIYLVPNFVAGALAAVVFRIVNGADDD